MKKVVLSLAVLFSMAMVSCGGNKAAEAQDSDSVVAVEETVVEEVAVDSAAAPAADSAAAPAADSVKA
ncbi:MAG: hypothetical protein K2J48_03600 [Muribaculaceae bacterium]|nr:hypothetical protein [Muribaculaceae bacterium]MDE6792151.1 hypothetical protein [Muribaculaceae bacterium]